MANNAGIKAEPVLINTRDHGFVRTTTPNSQQFNKVIVWTELDGKSILLDATDKFLPHNFLPENCLNGIGSGYRVGASTYQWIPLNDPSKTKTVINAKINVQENGSLKGDLTVRKNGYAAREVREKLKSNKKDEYLKSIFLHHSVDFTDNSFSETDSLQTQLQETHKFNLDDYCQVSSDAIFINPIIISRVNENPFKNEFREYPVDFHFPVEIVYSAKFTIPPGFEIDELPTQKLILLPDGGGKFLINCVRSADEISFSSQLVLNRSFFSQEEYPTLKEFYNIMTAKQAEQIVLKKRN